MALARYLVEAVLVDRRSVNLRLVLVCWHTMKRTTIKLPDALDRRLRHEAERRGVSLSELTREAIEDHLTGGTSRRRLAKAGASGRSDVAHRIEEILRSELAAR
jgi:metal-responsive CopG/Arc/MetJ family transcriptional regulator